MNNLRAILGGAVFAAIGTAAWAEIDILSVTFSCENNTQVPVSYFNASDGSGAAAMLVNDQLVALRQVQSGSGIRYVSEGGEGVYTLRSKGWDATISYQETGSGASEQVLFGNCSSR